MVGEIRDAETAHIAIRAALTGHLVITTMHTRDAKGGVHRLMEFGINKLEIKQTLIAVTAQRLVELVCPFCMDDCSSYCFSLNGQKKRASVFEIITGKTILQILEDKDMEAKKKVKTLAQNINKGIALGFIKATEYERWVYVDEKE